MCRRLAYSGLPFCITQVGTLRKPYPDPSRLEVVSDVSRGGCIRAAAGAKILIRMRITG